MSDKDSVEAEHDGLIARNWKSFTTFLWNKDTKEIAGRTVLSWIQITLFFIVLYAILTGFWLGLLLLAQTRLPDLEEGPRYTDYLSHRGPGIHVEPAPSVIGGDKQRIIRFSNRQNYVDATLAFLDARNDSAQMNDENIWGSCRKDNIQSSWDKNKPCFFLYLNAIHNFIPEPADGQNGKVNIKCKAAKEKYEVYMGEVEYYPADGFDVNGFPWKYGVDWAKEAPLVAFRFEAKVEKAEEGRIQCEVVAKNIVLDSEKPNIGMVDFRFKD